MKTTKLTFQEVRQIRLDAFKVFKLNPTIEGKEYFLKCRLDQLNYNN